MRDPVGNLRICYDDGMNLLRKTVLLFIFFTLLLVPVFAERRGRDHFPELFPGRPQTGAIRIQSQAKYETYKFRITSEMLGATIRLEAAEADLDLYLRFGSPMEDYSEADVYSETEMFNEELQLFRYDDTGLQEG